MRLLVAAGAALILTQYVAAREIGSTFFSSELVALAATVITLLGPSLAYAVADWIGDRLLLAWGIVSVTSHLALPLGLRPLVGWLTARGWAAWALGGTLALGAVLLCGFYAVFLPRLVRQGTGSPPLDRTPARWFPEPGSLGALYAAELVGAGVALGGLAVAPSWRATLALYWATDVLVLHLALRRRAVTVIAAMLAAGLIAFQPALDRAGAAAYYAGSHGHRQPQLVATAYSPYQRIDVVDDPEGRWLYLDGVPFFGPGALQGFNVMLAELSGWLQPHRGQALVIGSGSFSSAGHLKRLGYQVTVVEIDEAMARLGFAHFQPAHGLDASDVHVVVEDGRRFLVRAAPATYDMIVLDVPAPYHLRTALLHTPELYRLALTRLTPQGILAVSLSDALDGPVGRAIAASAASVLPQVMVAESAALGQAHLYGGRALPFDVEDVKRALWARDPGGGSVFSDAEVRRQLVGARPLSIDRLGIVLLMARSALPGLGQKAWR